MNILFTICGRAGSKGFKNKNLKEMNGVPLAYYSLASIKGFIDTHSENKITVALNTDSEPLINLIKKQNTVPVTIIPRKKELAGDIVPKVEVIRDTFLSITEGSFDVVVDLDITSPMRTIKDIENILLEYNNGDYDLVFSVVEARRSPYFNMVERKPDGYFRKICESKFTTRQQTPKSYEMNASIYAYNPNFLIEEIEGTILDHRCGISEMMDYLVLDIDSEDDFLMMQRLHEYYSNNDAGIEEVYSIAKTIK